MTRTRKLGLREWTEKKTIPMATRQRVACILNYQVQLPDSERWDIKIERAPVLDDWQPVEFSIPAYDDYYDYRTRAKVHIERLPG